MLNRWGKHRHRNDFIMKEVYAHRALETGGPCHAGPHREAPGLPGGRGGEGKPRQGLYCGFCGRLDQGRGDRFKMASSNNFSSFWGMRPVEAVGCLALEKYSGLECDGR